MVKGFNGFLRNLFTVVNKISSIFFITINPIMYHIGRKRERFIYNHDYLRLSSLELVAKEINENNMSHGGGGGIAELGVYRGDFAQYLNRLFPRNKLFLFDTFEGFNKKNLVKEDWEHLSTTRHDFSGTTVDFVLKRMKHPENCIIKKGFFPETAVGLENEEYIFVSLDVDLYEPTYEGLKYFYPHLKNGGYIFVHDYNSDIYKGVKKAVKEYAEEKKITYFPLSDYGGSVIFLK